MDWTTHTNVICAIYFDSFENEYVSYMEKNDLRLINCMYEVSKIKYASELEKSKIETKMDWRKS